MSSSRVPARIRHDHLRVAGHDVFFRESVPSHPLPGAPTLLLLHGFPSASHQFRSLMESLGDRFHMIAPDYPGFGHTQAVDGQHSAMSFEVLADTIEAFVEAVGLTRYAMYMFDFGAPVGFRLAVRAPDRVAALVVQNGNVYDEGLSDAARAFIALQPDTPGSTEAIHELLTLAGTRGQYETGVSDISRIAPDGWTLDQHFLDLPGRQNMQTQLAFDYSTNLAHYPEWQRWLRTNRPPTLILWGQRDPFFTEAGAHAYLHDVPDAQIRLLETGHFALEECLPEVVPVLSDFLSSLASELTRQQG